MYQRSNGTWCDTLPQGKGKPPKFFYGKTKAIVKEKMAAWTQQQEQGVLVKEAMETWFETIQNGKYHTVMSYTKPVKDIIEQFGETPLKQLSVADIQNYIDSLKKKGYKFSYLSLRKTVLSNCFDFYLSSRDVEYNPCSSVHIRKKQTRRNLAPADCIETVKKCVNEPFGLFPFLLLYTGLRKSEALALTDKDITDSISVNKQVIWKETKTLIETTKTENGIRTVVLLKPLKDALPKDFHGYLFSADGGKSPLTRSQFKSMWHHYCMDNGLCEKNGYIPNKKGWKITRYRYRICPHQLRHEFATICLDAGISVKDAADLMGHASEATTAQIYQHIKDSRRTSTYAKLEQFIETY